MRAVRHRERGSVALLSALSLIGIGAFLALGLNVGKMMETRASIQNATDSGALAGAKSLDGTAAGLAAARTQSVAFATMHALDEEMVRIDPANDVLFGIWRDSADCRNHPSAACFTAVPGIPPSPSVINAVKVTAGRDGIRNSALKTYFGAFLGGSGVTKQKGSAIAIAGGPASACSIPLAIAACKVPTLCENSPPLVFSDSKDDNVGFTNLDPERTNPNTAAIRELLRGQAASNGSRTCGNDAGGPACCRVGVGQVIGVSNGNNLNKNVVDAFHDGGYVGANGSGPVLFVPVLDIPCPGGNPKFNQDHAIVGFASFRILEVKGPPHPQLKVKFECRSTNEPPGGAPFGTSATARLAL